MKHKLFSLLMAVGTAFSVCSSVSAQVADGTYYIQNVESGKWLGAGNNWGTQASVLDHAQYWKLASVSSGVYSLESVVSNGGANYYLSGTYCDGGKTNLYFNAVAGKENTYTISTAQASAYLNASGAIVDNTGKDPASASAQWRIYSKDELLASFAKASPSNPVDATFLVYDFDLGRNHRDYNGNWNNTGATAPKTSGTVGGANANYLIEAYKVAFNVYQTIEVPNGTYRVRATAFYRQDGTDARFPYIYANDVKVTFPVRTGTENSMQTAAVSFAQGLYFTDYAEVIVTDGKLKIGAASEGTSCWSIFDNFEVYCVGLIADGDLSSYEEALSAIVSEANAITAPMNGSVKSSLTSAVSSNNKKWTSASEYNSAVSAIRNAISAANASVEKYKSAKTYIDAGNKLDANGKASYSNDATVKEVTAAYNAATLDAVTAEQITLMKAALAEAAKAQTTPGSDMSALIVNPEVNGADGWTTVKSVGGNGPLLDNASFEYWSYTLGTGGFDYWQEVELPAGVYKVSANMKNDQASSDDAFKPAAGLYATSGEVTVSAPVTEYAGDLKTYTTDEITVSDGKLRLGVKNLLPNNEMPARWFVADDFKLTLVKVGIALDDYAKALASAVAEAEKVSGNMNADVASALATAITNGKKKYTSESAYTSAIKEVNDAKSAAEASVLQYATAEEYLGKADGLDAAGKAAYQANETVSTVSAAYKAKSLVGLTDEQKAAMDAALLTATLAQTTAGADMTVAIVNPSFETGNLNGWTTQNGNDTGAKATNNATYMMSGSDGNYLFNTWSASTAVAPLSQTVSGLRPGKYSVSAVMASDNVNTLYLRANTSTAEATSDDKGTGVVVTSEINVIDGVLAIEVGTVNGAWYKADKFQLTLVKALSESEIEAIRGELAAAELAAAKSAKLAELDNLSPVGDMLFGYTQKSIDDAKASVTAAKTKEEVSAVSLPVKNNPSEDKAYIIALASSGAYMNISADAITLAGSPQKLYFTMNGNNVTLANEDGVRLAYRGDNTWTLIGSEDAGSDLTFVPVEGGYTITGKNGYIGVDNTGVGSSLFGNKKDATFVWTVSEFSFDTYYNAIAELVTEAEKYVSAPMKAEEKAALTSAYNAGKNAGSIEDADQLSSIQGNLASAVAAAKTSAESYASGLAAVGKAEDILSKTNVYTAEAYNTFKASADAVKAGLNDGTITNEAAKEFAVSAFGNGWHSANTVDDLLLSAWDNANEYEGALYINTWSVEADNKENGSGMTVPFFEYFTAEANTLTPAKWIANLSGLENGLYKVSALVRVRMTNGVTEGATGITLNVNGGASADVCGGNACEDGDQFLVGTFEAEGLVKDGKLTVAFDVAEGTNISWLSFKNVKYTKVRDLTDAEKAVAPTAITLDATKASLTPGQKATFKVASYTPGNATAGVTWTSSNENVAVVADGVVTAVGEGEAVITATSVYADVKATATVTVAYPSEIANADFADGIVGDVNIATYAKDGDVCQMQPVPGWSFGIANGDARAAGVMAYGSGTTLGGAEYKAPASGPEGTNGNVLGMVGVWTGSVQYVQTVSLPAGDYALKVPVLNTFGTIAFVKNLIGVKFGDTEVYANTTAYPVGEWKTELIEFTLTEKTPVTVSLGYQGANAGSAASQHLFIDRVVLLNAEQIAAEKEAAAAAELAAAKNAKIKTIQALVVGTKPFQYSQKSVDAAISSVNAATSTDEVSAVSMPVAIAPETGKAYQIVLPESECFISISGEGIKLAGHAQPIFFEADGDNWKISNGSEYIDYAGNNAWTMTANVTGHAFTIAAVSESEYSITGVNGRLGVDAVTAGSAVFGNKKAGLWLINEFDSSDIIADAPITIESYETLTADKITIDLAASTVEGNTTAVVNNGKVAVNSASVRLTIPNNEWSFVKFPCDIPASELKNTQANTTWMISQYDGEARSKADMANVWKAMSAKSVLSTEKGYIIQSRRGDEATSTFEYTTSNSDVIARIFTSEDVTISLDANASTYASNAGWNLVGNPYIAYYDISGMSVSAPITVWNGTTYEAYSPKDDNYVLSPLEAFFIQTDVTTASVTFGKDGRQATSETATASAARVRRVSAADRSIYNVVLSDGTYSDKTRFVLNQDASCDYEIGVDASKFMSTNSDVPQIFTVEAGESLAINERPMADGAIRLGAYFGKSGEYTISIPEADGNAVLVDRLAGESVELGNGADSYVFSADAGVCKNRFVLYVGDDATAISAIMNNEYANDEVYTLQGVKVSQPAAGGIYIINGKKVMIKK